MENLKLDRREFLKMAGIASLSAITGITLTSCNSSQTIDVTHLNDYKIYTYKLNDGTTNVIIAQPLEKILVPDYGVKRLTVTDEMHFQYELITSWNNSEEEALNEFKTNFGIIDEFNTVPVFVSRFGAKKEYTAEEVNEVINTFGKELDQEKENTNEKENQKVYTRKNR